MPSRTRFVIRARCVREAAFVSRERPSFEAIVREFLAQGNENVHRCAVGVAGPVLAGRSLVVNLRWPVDARRLARELGLAPGDSLITSPESLFDLVGAYPL